MFGKVVKGMAVVDRIAVGRTATRSGLADVQVSPAAILSVKEVP